MKSFLIVILSIFIFSTAYAKHDGANAGGGGQVNRPDLSPLETDEGCLIIVPPGIDLEDCIDNTASPTSYLESWICNGVTIEVICPEEDDD